MTFTNILFLFYFLPIILILYFLAPRKHRNTVLFAGSLVFCAWGEPLCFLALLLVMIFSFVLCKKILKTEEKQKRKTLLGLIVSLIMLFFVSINVTHAFFPFVNSINYIGFVLVTLRLISFAVDVYRGETANEISFINYGTYITMFPIIIAGPNLSYSEIEIQLTSRIGTIEGFSRGLMRFAVGLSKKVLVADVLYSLWTSISKTPFSELSTASAWLGLAVFGLSVYHSLSGYSDMAIGLGKMFGFQYSENFNYPFISTSITQFIKRWFICLSEWNEKYILSNLKIKANIKIFITLLLIGVMHGAGLNYILWGAYFALILVLERVLTSKRTKMMPKIFKWIYTMIFVTIGWTFFANNNLPEMLNYFKVMFGFSGNGFLSQTFLYDISSNSVVLTIAVLSSFPFGAKLAREYVDKNPVYAIVPTFVALILCLAYII